MFPTEAAISGADQFQAARGTLSPAHFAAMGVPLPQLPAPNAALGDRMRRRDWAGREQQGYYEMQHAPLPTQYSRNAPHPLWGGGDGNAVSQYDRPQGPPTGFAARGLSRSHLDAGGRSPTFYGVRGVARPSHAYNRVVGRGAPTMYTGTWPAQYYPGGSNTYIPSWEATGLIVKYTRNPSFFRINRYVKDLKVPRDMGYYLTLDGDQPYRVVSINDYLWEDSVDAPGGRQERQGFGFMPYRTARYCFPFSLGKKSVDQAEWPVLAEHAAMVAAKAMTVRTMLNTTLATTAANWSGTWGTNTSAASGQWTNPASNTNLYLQTDINTGLIAIEQATGGIVADEEALQFTINPTLARGIGKAYEYRDYIKGSPDALAAITDQRNPNRKYQLAPYLYGLRLTVENAVRVTTPKSGNVPSPPAQSRSYIWPTASAVISSRPQGIVAPEAQTLDFSTFCFRFYEQMTTESKSDSDNRREVGRVVEDFVCTLQAPQTGYLFTGAS